MMCVCGIGDVLQFIYDRYRNFAADELTPIDVWQAMVHTMLGDRYSTHDFVIYILNLIVLLLWPLERWELFTYAYLQSMRL